MVELKAKADVTSTTCSGLQQRCLHSCAGGVLVFACHGELSAVAASESFGDAVYKMVMVYNVVYYV